MKITKQCYTCGHDCTTLTDRGPIHYCLYEENGTIRQKINPHDRCRFHCDRWERKPSLWLCDLEE